MTAVINYREMRLAPSHVQAQPRPVGSAIFSEHAWVAIARSLKLSAREMQIVRGIFDDDTDLGIAQHLGISLHTVHTHVERLHHKLAITDRPQLLLRVLQEFLSLTVAGEHLPPLCANHASRCCPFSL